MFLDQDYSTILQRMIDNALWEYPNADTREGSMIHLAESPAAVEFQNVYLELERVLNEAFANTASRDYLIRRAEERGLSPYPASKAVMKLEVNPEAQVQIGDRFAYNEFTYIVTEIFNESEGLYIVECEQEGSAPNGVYGTAIPLTQIEDFTIGEIVETLVPGEDEEDTESFRQRYFNSVKVDEFGGNVAYYQDKTNSIGGVGATKVIPAWDGGGTVKLLILDSEYNIASSVLINEVQEIIDPTQDGSGVGIAPIGHVVTVDTAKEKTINIAVGIEYESGWGEDNWEEIKKGIAEAVDAYFQELKEQWVDKDCVIRTSRIVQACMGVDGVLDVLDLTINDQRSNIQLNTDEVPVRGEISVLLSQ